jgi:hypothetical protein
MMGYLSFPAEETGYDLTVSHPALHAWLSRLAALPERRMICCPVSGYADTCE